MNVHLIRLDPYDPNLGLLVPIVARRVQEYAREHSKELDPKLVTRGVMVPLWNQDPSVLVLAMVNPEGTVVGHSAAAIQTDGASCWATLSQTQADGAVGDAVKRAVEHTKQWVLTEINPKLVAGGRLPVTSLTMVTGKNEKAWERDLGFKLERRVVVCPLTPTQGEEGLMEGSG